MRPRATKPAPSPLHSLVAALPDAALRPLLLELMTNGTNASAGEPAPATEVRRRRRGWPKGKPRGRRPSTRAQDEGSTRAHQMKNGAAAPSSRRGKPGGSRGPGRPRKAIDPGLDAKILAKRKREAQRQRDKRAAAAAKAKVGTTSKAAVNGNVAGVASNGAKVVEAGSKESRTFWAHAELLQPGSPWRAVARELGTNEAQAKNHYRTRTLPPSVSASAAERFLEVRAT